ncbi:winged helix family transcriptional regulator [Pedobacter sp. L105]|uniref:winged helix family transcriptional regulator n=1 Tax=Pedobacter sp. L105 TaxID=1641871 RepID=UPI00131A8A0D|nr:winged helix family transcriptional regulator [Pedobacter sp. L105]
MLDSRNLLLSKGTYLIGSVLLLFFYSTCAAFGLTDGDDFALERRQVLFRRIGHELLLQSGDSTSRVLPIKIVAENEYQIRFEHEFTFQTDSLLKTTRRILSKDPLVGDYVVKVLNSGQPGVVYGYAIAKNAKEDIISCVGRKQPKANYMINVKLKPIGIDTAKNGYLLGSLPFLAFVGFIFLRSVKPGRGVPDEKCKDILSLGRVLFDTKNRKLKVGGETIKLTRTETRVLLILAMAPNEIIERSKLQKEIWEDEGVFVGRSLDMFISKLRKKLECDSNIQLVVIRGKGYKLNIGS